MKPILSTQDVTIPKGVTVEVSRRIVKVKGPRGELERNFRHFDCDIRKVSDKKVRVDVWFGSKKKVAGVRTIASHIKNLITGVTIGFERKMRFVYAHFPIQCNLPDQDPFTKKAIPAGSLVEIKNFLGEHIVRRIYMQPGVIASRSDVKDELVLQGNNVELVGRSAAEIYQSCLVKNKDIRKFLDGVYVSEKGHVVKDD